MNGVSKFYLDAKKVSSDILMNQILTRKTRTEDVVSNGVYITGILVDSIYYLIRNFKWEEKCNIVSISID